MRDYHAGHTDRFHEPSKSIMQTAPNFLQIPMALSQQPDGVS